MTTERIIKRMAFLLFAFMLAIGFCACGAGSSSDAMEFEPLEWPEYDNAKQIPIPNSNMAYVRNSTSRCFEFYLPDMSIDDYKSYVEECKTMGFTVSAIEQEQRYHAFNDAEYELTVQYQEESIMYVEVVEKRLDIEIKLLHTDKASADMYNLRIEIDGAWEADAEQGSEAISFDSYLKEGPHVLRVENDDDDNINGRLDFVASEDGEYIEFEIECLSNRINIRQLTDSKTVDAAPDSATDTEEDESTETESPEANLDIEDNSAETADGIGVVANIYTSADIPDELMNDELKNVVDLFSKGFSQSGLDIANATTYNDGETQIFYLENLEFLGSKPKGDYFSPRVIYSQDAINNDGVPDEIYFAFSYPRKSNGYEETVEMVEDIAAALNISDEGLIDNDYSSSSAWATGKYATFIFPNLSLKLTVSNMQSSVEIEIFPID